MADDDEMLKELSEAELEQLERKLEMEVEQEKQTLAKANNAVAAGGAAAVEEDYEEEEEI